jgi:hypothetical protein
MGEGRPREELPETRIVGLLHHTHLVQLEGLVQRGEELGDLRTYLQGELVCLHLILNVEVDEILDDTWLEKGFVPSFLALGLLVRATKNKGHLTQKASKNSDSTSLEAVSINFGDLLLSNALLELPLVDEERIDLLLESLQFGGLASLFLGLSAPLLLGLLFKARRLNCRASSLLPGPLSRHSLLVLTQTLVYVGAEEEVGEVVKGVELADEGLNLV